MNKAEILLHVYDALKANALVRSRLDFSQKINYNYTCTSAAFNGAERYLNDRFFTRILRAFPQVREEYIRTGRGEILYGADDTTPSGIIPFTDNQQTEESWNTTIDLRELIALIREQQEQTRRQQAQTEQSLEQTNKLINIITSMLAGESTINRG